LRTSKDERLLYDDNVADDPVAANYKIDASVKLEASSWSTPLEDRQNVRLKAHQHLPQM
jgi:hypothetical protein